MADTDTTKQRFDVESNISDPGLAQEGHRKIDWVAQHAPVLNHLRDHVFNDGTFEGLNIGVTVPLEAKTAYLSLILRDVGARVVVVPTSPDYLQDDVAAALVERGVTVFGRSDQSLEAYEENFDRALELQLDFVVDDRAEFARVSHTRHKDALSTVKGGSEETTSGVTALRAMEAKGDLTYPAIAANDAMCKHLFDNRYGTGQSTLASIMSNTNLYIGGKRVVVAGYGWCSRGLARVARGLNARVIVCEVDPVRALEAFADGFEVMPMDEAAEVGEIFITSTGSPHVIRGRHFKRMRDGAVLANAGGLDTEIDVDGLHQLAVDVRHARDHVQSFVLEDGRRLDLIAGGNLANIAAADGHPVEIMDLTFSVQASAVYHLANNHQQMEARVYDLPRELDRLIARTKLETLGMGIDELTEEQRQYLTSWR